MKTNASLGEGETTVGTRSAGESKQVFLVYCESEKVTWIKLKLYSKPGVSKLPYRISSASSVSFLYLSHKPRC